MEPWLYIEAYGDLCRFLLRPFQQVFYLIFLLHLKLFFIYILLVIQMCC